MTNTNIPQKFDKLLHLQLAEVINETERLADRGFIIMTNPEIYHSLIAYSDKLKNYEFFTTYYDYALMAGGDYDSETSDIVKLSYDYQKAFFGLSKEEQLITNALFESQDFFEKHYTSNESDIYYFSQDRSFSTPKTPCGFNIPMALSNTPIYSKELKSYVIENNIKNDEFPAGLILNALTKTFGKEKQVEHTSCYVAKNYLNDLIAVINDIVQENESLGFLTKEIYKATRYYTIDDIDKHLTTDIPQIPYTEGQLNLKSVYIYQPEPKELKPEATDVCEFLFVTESDYFSVKLRVDSPHKCWFIETNVYQKKKLGPF